LNTSEGKDELDRTQVKRLRRIFGKQLLLEAADRWAYGYDNSRQQALPLAVCLAHSHAQVVDLVRFCVENRIPLIPRGKGTGTTGAVVPADGGIVLSLEQMTDTLTIDPDNRLAVVSPGPRENTLALRAVTGTGETLDTGTRTTKGVVGYDLTRLLIGSEGTLGIITEAVLKLTPLAAARRTLQASYRSIETASAAVSALMAQPLTPSTLEFMDGQAIDMVRDYSDLGLPPEARALLMIEVDGSADAIEADARRVGEVARNAGCLGLELASSDAEVERLWRTRKALSPALRNIAPKKINEDVAVPVARLPDLISGLQALSSRHAIPIVNFGHAGNGNIHVNLLLDPDDPVQASAAEACLTEVFDLVLALEGTLSGEHGVGRVKRDFVQRELSPVALRLMQGIKQQFDPHNILNPGVGFRAEPPPD